MQKVKTAKFLWCSFVCVAITLFLVAPASAEWNSVLLQEKLTFNTELKVFGPDPGCLDADEETDCIPGLVELPIFDGGGQSAQVDANDIIKVEATLEIIPGMPLPLQIRLVFGGLGYVTAPRTWTLRSAGTYKNSAYFMVSGNEGVKQIGAKAWVKYLPTGELPAASDTNLLLDEVTIGPLP